MNYRTRTVAGLLSAAVVAVPALALAQGQIDTNPPKPNVLVLLDNSGSMERMIDGTLPEASPANACNCDPSSGQCAWTQTPQPNRWNVVQQALSGSLANGFNCVAMPRTPGSTFADEYQIAGTTPYDLNYYLPFHRMVAQDNSSSPSVACVVAPGGLPGATTPGGVGPNGNGLGGLATDFAGSIVTRPYGQQKLASSSCNFAQLPNGAMSSMTDLMRFGLMTFDQDPSPATGVNTPGLTVANPAFAGMWTYYPGWNLGTPCTYFGNPANCSTQTLMAVGARNPAAPPWEGRMVPFPSTNDISGQETNNAHIASVVLASRPYGATPMAGMFTGAKYYMSADPTGPQLTDPYVQGGCRNEYIILLTDGAPNDDMRPGCSQSGGAPSGVCPFDYPENIAASLYNNGVRAGNQQFVTTYVVGFAVSSFQDQGSTVYCSSLAVNGAVSAQCATPSPAYGPCCELQKIAVNGGSKQAYFADTPGDLQRALGAILADISKQATTRTTPAYSPVISSVTDPSGPAQTSASTFLASFNPSPGQPWSGNVQRQRYDCASSGSGPFTVQAPPVSAALGDDFAANLNSGAGVPRTYIAIEPALAPGASKIDSTATIRPYAQQALDGVGVNLAHTIVGKSDTIISQLTPDALGIPMTGAQPGCAYSPNNALGTAYLTPDQCKSMLIDYTFAQPFTGPSNFTFQSRVQNAFGDVFHASPVVVGPPSALIEDPTYTGFRAAWNAVPGTSGRGQSVAGNTKPRDQIVYVATNDGLLHAFWADETKLEDNEEWAFLPPAVMPNLLSSYPSSHQFLLDGTPVVKDVVWTRAAGSFSDNTVVVWHTMLVAGFGPYQRGYYAVDVTNPDAAGLASGGSSLSPPGPQFRWQLTKLPATNYPIFGDHSAIPAIATVFIDRGAGPQETGVAILPGGMDQGGPTSSLAGGPSCARATKTSDSAPPFGAFPARTAVRCWGKNQKATDVVNGRSVSVVSVATGEILRVFTRKADVATFPTDTLGAANLITDTALDSPMTGTPVVYPGQVGSVATKAFVGDADGTIWRFDLSSTNPANWFGELFLDTYNGAADTSSTSWGDGQPFEVPMVSSLDTAGELVLNVATGNLESFDSSGSDYLYSITEKVQGSPAKLRAAVNWYLGPQSQPVALRTGERVSGPMTVFDGTLYFSTYWAGDPTVQSCNGGSARLWGFDFVIPRDPNCNDPKATTCDRSQGGLRELLPPTRPDFVDPTATPYNVPQGAVIPGVSIKASPACASLATRTGTSYYGGAAGQQPQNFTAGSYSLFAQVGSKGGSGSNGVATGNVELPLSPPSTPTVIDSWAAVLE